MKQGWVMSVWVTTESNAESMFGPEEIRDYVGDLIREGAFVSKVLVSAPRHQTIIKTAKQEAREDRRQKAPSE